MASRLNATRKSAREYVKRMEAAGYAPANRKHLALTAMADYTWAKNEARPYYRNRRNRKVLQRDAMKHGYGCTGASVRAFTLYINKVEEINNGARSKPANLGSNPQ